MASMPTSHMILISVLSAVVGVVGAGCGGAETRNGQTPTATPSNHPGIGTSGIPSSADKQEERMKIRITIGEQHFQATLSDSAAARDLIAQLPVTIDMVDHGAVEKTGTLPSPLSLDGQPEGANPDVGDVGYYAPGNDLVLYYGDQSYYPGMVILGRLNAEAAQKISGLDGSITTTVEAHGD